MATSRGRRITVVNPWIPGGEGQLRDLFPMPPVLFLTFKAISSALRHYYITFVILVSFYLWIWEDWSALLAFIVFPLAFLTLRLIVITFWLWYRNPTIPIFARRP